MKMRSTLLLNFLAAHIHSRDMDNLILQAHMDI